MSHVVDQFIAKHFCDRGELRAHHALHPRAGLVIETTHQHRLTDIAPKTRRQLLKPYVVVE